LYTFKDTSEGIKIALFAKEINNEKTPPLIIIEYKNHIKVRIKVILPYLLNMNLNLPVILTSLFTPLSMLLDI
jgi:hypothetical protein